MLKQYYPYFFLSLGVSLLTIPVVMYWSKKKNLVDTPDERKIHVVPVSRLGGSGIFLGFITSFLLFHHFNPGYFTFNFYLFLGAAVLAFLLGFVDDLVGIRARYKVVLQLTTGALVYASGLQFSEFRFFDVALFNFGVLSPVITTLWIVAFMNAINLLDGMDGLASGVVFLASFFILMVSISTGNVLVGFIALAVMGSILGFYVFNFPPAKIFMGDGGAYFLGFIYAVSALMGLKKATLATIFVLPLVLLLIPLVDIAQVIFTRVKLKRSIMEADRNHIHHRLLQLGFSVKQILLVIYTMTALLGCFTLIMLQIPNSLGFPLFALLFVFVFLFLFVLNAAEKIIEKNSGKDRDDR